MARKQPGRPPLAVDLTERSHILRLLQSAYRMEGEPGAERLAHAAKVRHMTVLKWLRAYGVPAQFVGVERLFAALGYELRLAKTSPSVVEHRAAEAVRLTTGQVSNGDTVA